MGTVLANRLGKAKQFLRVDEQETAELHPFPSEVAGFPYFLVLPIRNDDRRGGYARNHRFDDVGIPYRLEDGGAVYRPMIVARYALKMLAIYRKSRDPRDLQQALAVVPALAASSQPTGFWAAGSDARTMSGERGHSNVQGTVLSLLVRVLRQFPTEVDTAAVEAAIERGFERLVGRFPEDGCAVLFDGRLFLEEFVHEIPSHILGGCITGLFGLYDLADALDQTRARVIAGRIEACLEHLAPSFTTRFGWSCYALNTCGVRIVSSMHYHRSLIWQLEILASRTGSPVFKSTVEQWKYALHSPMRRWTTGIEKLSQAFWLRTVRNMPLAEG